MSELLMIEQRGGHPHGAPWILEGGRKLPGMDDRRRVAELRNGLVCHAGVRPSHADAATEDLEWTLGELHERDYLETLKEVRSEEPVVMPDLAAPGLPPDIPVSAGLVAAAREGVRTAITAAARLVEGARFSYALCRPPGHHAGPDWFAGYCYLNSAAAAAFTLREGGLKPVGILDLDLHYPNGTAAIVARMDEASLHSLHAWPVTNVAARTVTPSSDRERVIEFSGSPSTATYLGAVARSVEALSCSSEALVVSLGYDTVKGDPHGSWGFSPTIFAQIGRLLAASGRPVCIVQEGGYALQTLAACSYAFAAGLLDEGAPV
jgi:acetoin utilization deacetylase AcuC-like enzyme